MGRVKNSARSAASSINSAFRSLGSLFVGGELIAGIKGIMSKMDDISDRAKRFGVTTGEIQKVGNAAEIVGTNFETVARAMDRAGVSANKAAREGGSVADAFARVNLDPAAFSAAKLEDRIKMIAAAQRATNGDSQKMADLFEVIGVRAAGINFAELDKEMGQVNAASDDVVQALAEANDQLEKMQQGATIFGANLLKSLLIDPAQRLGGFLGGAGFKTIDEIKNKQLEDQAKRNLQGQGKLLPSDTTTRQTTIATPVGPILGGSQLVLGPNDKENARMIAEEVERLKKAQEAILSQKFQSAVLDNESERSTRATNELLKERSKLLGQHMVYSKEQSAQLAALRDKRSEAVQIYNDKLAELQMVGGSSEQDRMAQIEQLNRQYDEFVALAEQKTAQVLQSVTEQARTALAEQMRQAAATEQQRQQAAAQSQQQSQVPKDIATETTLQKAVAFLQELTTKTQQQAVLV